MIPSNVDVDVDVDVDDDGVVGVVLEIIVALRYGPVKKPDDVVDGAVLLRGRMIGGVVGVGATAFLRAESG